MAQRCSKKILNQICSDQQCNEDYCILKEIILHDAKYDNRLLYQFGCVSIFKYEESQRQKADIGWKNAWLLWVETGLAAKFAELYNEEQSVKVLYAKILDK